MMGSDNATHMRPRMPPNVLIICQLYIGQFYGAQVYSLNDCQFLVIPKT